MIQLTVSEMGTLAVTFGASAFFVLSMANRIWVAVLCGVVLSLLLISFCGIAVASVTAGQDWRVAAQLLLFLVAPVALCALSGMFVQRHRNQINQFAYGASTSLMSGCLRWSLRSRNVVVSIIAVLFFHEFSLKSDVSPAWLLMFWLMVAGAVLASADGFGVRANIIILNALPASARRLRWLNFLIVLSTFVFAVVFIQLPTLTDSDATYSQLAVFSLTGSLISAGYSMIYRFAASEAENSSIKVAISQTLRISQEVTWALVVIGLSYLPNAFGWSWPSALIVIVAASIGIPVIRTRHRDNTVAMSLSSPEGKGATTYERALDTRLR